MRLFQEHIVTKFLRKLLLNCSVKPIASWTRATVDIAREANLWEPTIFGRQLFSLPVFLVCQIQAVWSRYIPISPYHYRTLTAILFEHSSRETKPPVKECPVAIAQCRVYFRVPTLRDNNPHNFDGNLRFRSLSSFSLHQISSPEKFIDDLNFFKHFLLPSFFIKPVSHLWI